MSECPSTSLVKIPSKRVAELCEATIARCQAAHARDLAPFEAKITAEVESRKSSRRRWFRQSSEREAVIRDLCSDWSWSLNYMFAKEPYKAEEKARRLLAASKEADEVWVSTSDLMAVLL